MICEIYIDPRVRKQQQAMARSGKKAAMAAEQVDRIIERLTVCGRLWDEAASLTKHGELRIKSCVKFDLGSGYRLITLKQSDALLVLYAGSHDDCDRWIENNRELQVDLILNRCDMLAVQKQSSTDNPNSSLIDENAETFALLPEAIDDPLETPIGERELRYVFRGLCGQ